MKRNNATKENIPCKAGQSNGKEENTDETKSRPRWHKQIYRNRQIREVETVK
jgi:hypothetical protein